MCNIYKRYAESLLNIFKLHLHILAKLEIKRTERFVKKKDSRLNGKCTGNGNTLLLTARKRIDISSFKAVEVDKVKHFLNRLADFLFLHLLDTKSERNVLVNIQMRKQRITLKNGVNLSLMRRYTIDNFILKDNLSAVRFKESGNNAQCGCFSAARRP